MRITTLLTFLFVTCITLHAQLQTSIPYSLSSHLPAISQFEKLPTFDKKKAAQLSADMASHLKRRYFGKAFSTYINPYNAGQWNDVGSGRVWRVGLVSSGAYSILLTFGTYQLSPGVQLYAYSPRMDDATGAYTSANNNSKQKLSIAPIIGDSIIIELDIPATVQDFGQLVLTKVSHDYMNEFGVKLTKSATTTESCNININCELGVSWQNEKQAVCKYSFINNSGMTEVCTGTLINSLIHNKQPYLLTANHCLSDETFAAEAIFYFNYEQVSCTGSVKTKPVTLSGAELIATTPGILDFSLVKLNQRPPVNWNTYLAGWQSANTAPQSAVCIHHPDGDVKKISIDNDPLISASFGEGYLDYSHWMVQEYDNGATQGGSSGAAIFDSQHHITGTLTGGEASCSNPVNDYFSKFCLAWNSYSDSAMQLQHWLDPLNTGQTEIDGQYLYSVVVKSTDTINNTEGELLELSQNGLSKGYISGQNSLGYTQFAEQFHTSSPSMISGVIFNVAKNIYSNAFSTVTLKIWTGGKLPQTEIYSQTIYSKEFIEDIRNYIYLDSLISVTDTFFVGYAVDYTFAGDTFAVYHAQNRTSIKLSNFFVYKDEWINANKAYSPPYNTSLDIGLILNQTTETKTYSELKIGPNPCTSSFKVYLPDNIILQTIESYNLFGQHYHISYQRVGKEIIFDTSNIPSGTYVLVVKSQTSQFVQKVVVIHK